ncbi:phenylalanine--tRNA ligase subunit alpha [Candidatus Parcubacteria bacterium]|nr:MAG: phenylalanine--tRNA ligase subunit alpha [Candidatus Parcubacteria bacterium]
MEEELLKIKNDASTLIFEAEDTDELNKIKLSFLGKKGILTFAIKNLSKIPIERRPEIGKLANEIKNTLEILVEDKEKALNIQKETKIEKKHIDVTLPGIKPQLGHLHLVTQAIEEITAIFEKIGFERVRYPEAEWDWYGFTALNFPENHPARDEWETFFIDRKPHPKYGPMILTPHTSSGQIREMERRKPPIRMLNIAKCYRRQSDVSHTPMFHQMEGLVVNKNISINHLKGTLDYFARSYYGEERKARIRPYHFQFTEPSFEVDISCGVCKGKGCKLCKEGWLELGGAGMVHPNVLKNGGFDPKEYTGFAFGWGIERVLMMKEGIEIDDLRTLYSTNLDFLEQF